MPLLFDGRWRGAHGIGRFARELGSRLFPAGISMPSFPGSPLNPFDPFVQGLRLASHRDLYFFSPGFNPPAIGRARSIFTVHDLIHLRVPGEAGALKRQYYEQLVKPSIGQCFRVFTASDYSRDDILTWSGASERQVVKVGVGVGEEFFAPAEHLHRPGFPYLLYVGGRKPHKNLQRLVRAYARSKVAGHLPLLISGSPETELMRLAADCGVEASLRFSGPISDAELPAYYQGAVALLFPSYFEGFGLPPLEAMAGGTPALTSNCTSLPEAVGDAALMVDPYSIEALADGIERIAGDTGLRQQLQSSGPLQARKHSWESVVAKISPLLQAMMSTNKP